MNDEASCCPVDDLKVDFKNFALEVRSEFRLLGAELNLLKVQSGTMSDKVDRVHKTLHEGNGRPALVSQVAVLENRQDVADRKVDALGRTDEEKTKASWSFKATALAAFLALIGQVITAILLLVKK